MSRKGPKVGQGMLDFVEDYCIGVVRCVEVQQPGGLRRKAQSNSQSIYSE